MVYRLRGLVRTACVLTTHRYPCATTHRDLDTMASAYPLGPFRVVMASAARSEQVPLAGFP